ncbi:ankyrin repeat domain-containing protein 13C-like [Centruroides sculpturatus]|uniref:ankyrin repeat domain-containing protein 13C-like n=2 Tax=Centruroides sculpturatus TaxID=218467 RepID=UPI000C6DC5DC|nr:ankyrin repeat domain-containing protein 13C-like [Centruroides sculpturatus]
MADVKNRYPLHESVFSGDVRRVASLLRTHDVAQKDMNGNTPLHIAVMLGHKECVQLLLAHGAPVKMKNIYGWSPLAEAISYGDRQTIASLLRKLKSQSREAMELRRPDLIRALNQMGDFFMELKWDFQSWVPLVSRILPSDICRIHKKGSNIRLDTTLVDFSDMKWERGDISFLFNGDAKPSKSLIVLDNKLKVYQIVRYEESEAEIEDEVDILMSSDIVAAQMSTKSITFTRAQTGWLFREYRTEMVGPFLADFYIINGLLLESRKRREHLTEEDLQKNKAIIESFTKGNSVNLDGSEPQRRKSLQPPKVSRISWEEYVNAPVGKNCHLGRSMMCKETSKVFKATLAMSEEFPLSVDALLNVLEVIAPFKHFNKLREFVQMKLPSGFPVKIDIPILPTVTARITFQDFHFRKDLADALFDVPSEYQEDPNRFPDL